MFIFQIFVINSVLQVHIVFFFFPQFCQAVPNLKGTLILPWSRTNFCQVSKLSDLQFTGINLIENVKWGNLILLFRVYTFRQLDSCGHQIFWCFQLRTRLPNSKLAGDKNNVWTFLAGPNKSCQPSVLGT